MKRLLQFIKVILPVSLIPILTASVYVLSYFFFGIKISTPMGIVVVLVFSIFWGIFWYFYTKRHISSKLVKQAKIQKSVTPVPPKLKNKHNKILKMGFELIAEYVYPEPISFTTKLGTNWLYINPERTIVIWSTKTNKTNFASYYHDDFVVGTQYPNGTVVERDNCSFNVVTTSIEAALDFHLHHCDVLSSEHNLVVIEDIQIIKDFELTLVESAEKNIGRIYGESLGIFNPNLQILFGLLIIGGVYFLIVIPNFEQYLIDFPLLDALFVLFPLILFIAVLVIGMIRIIWKLEVEAKANTVEARKAKKREG